MTYMLPSSTTPLPGGLTLLQYLQTVFVGVSGLPGNMVRPKWQVEPPRQLDLTTNWMAFGIDVSTPDANAWVDTNADESVGSQRNEILDIGCSIYGPLAQENYGIIRDGFSIPANFAALTIANMGFTEISAGRHIPDLINERFVNRVAFSVIIRRLVQRVYPIPTLISATGTIHTVLGDEQYLLDWATQT